MVEDPNEHKSGYVDDDGLQEFQDRYGQISRLLHELERDVEKSEELVKSAFYEVDNAFARRTFVRAVFAEVEGVCASILDWAAYYAEGGSETFQRYSDAERALLLKRVPVWRDGEVRFEEARLGTEGTVRFALDLVGRGAPSAPKVERGGSGWDAFRAAIKVRDRLMHPKTVHDVFVSDAELERVRHGRTWFFDTFKAREAAVRAASWEGMKPFLFNSPNEDDDKGE